MTDILARLAVCEKASIDECYLDITVEARKRMEAQEQAQAPIHPHQVHVCGQVIIQYIDLPLALLLCTVC